MSLILIDTKDVIVIRREDLEAMRWQPPKDSSMLAQGRALGIDYIINKLLEK